MSYARSLANSGIQLANAYPLAASLLLGFGAITIAKFCYRTLSLKRYGAKKGAWAIVTGTSDGIDKEFAFQLAKAGFNVFLVARNLELLDTAAAEIASKYSVSTQTASIDFAKDDDAAYEILSQKFQGLDVGVLVNNVGKSHAMPVYLVDTPKEEMADIVSINVNATMRVTYSILPGMIHGKRGLILNIGSFAGAIPSPMLATYSGTKAFLATFTSALAEEVRQHGITVEHINTYFVVSKLSKIRKSSTLIS
ncbi:uncharacterized protein C8R40DRAFT_1113971, partial [Lentinula edodes]|uniref:uncharacterized protein n=1 Tax=Lentinula edodes TaxID=5353 RepID=UPI001E8EABE3